MTDPAAAPLNQLQPPAWRAVAIKVITNLVTAGAVYADHKWGLQLDAETQGLEIAVLFAGANAAAHWIISKVPGLAPILS
jgi:hypothetical protein